MVRGTGASRRLAPPTEGGSGPAVPGRPRHALPLPLRRRQGLRAARRGGVLPAHAAVLARRRRPSGAVRPRRHQEAR